MKKTGKILGLLVIAALIMGLAACEEVLSSAGIKIDWPGKAILGVVRADIQTTVDTKYLGGSGTISYQWKVSPNSNGSGAANVSTEKFYAPAMSDIGKYLLVEVGRDDSIGKVTSNVMQIRASDQALPSVSKVTIAPKTAKVTKGDELQFDATVDGANLDAEYEAVVWLVTGAKENGTSISNNGLLTVAANETAKSLVVRAISVVDAGRTDLTTVTVENPGPVNFNITISGTLPTGNWTIYMFETKTDLTTPAKIALAKYIYYVVKSTTPPDSANTFALKIDQGLGTKTMQIVLENTEGSSSSATNPMYRFTTREINFASGSDTILMSAFQPVIN